MKKVVPHSGKVAKEARECVQECVSEFISFITRLTKTIQCTTTQYLTTSVRLFYLILDFDLTLTYSEASERCQAEKRKTINGEEETRLFAEFYHSLFPGEDILFAMSTLGFDNYVEPLKLYLQKYREAMKV